LKSSGEVKLRPGRNDVSRYRLARSTIPLDSGYPANLGVVGTFERCGVSALCLTEAAEFFFVAAHGGSDGVQRDA